MIPQSHPSSVFFPLRAPNLAKGNRAEPTQERKEERHVVHGPEVIR